MPQIVSPELIEAFGRLDIFLAIVLFLCIVAVGSMVMNWLQGRTFKSLVDTLKSTNLHLSSTMSSQQTSADKREDKLADALNMQAQEAGKIARALLLINQKVEDTGTKLGESDIKLIENMQRVGDYNLENYLRTMGELQTNLNEQFTAIGKQLEREAQSLRELVSRIPEEREERGKRLDAILGHLEMLMPKLNKIRTGTFAAVAAGDISDVVDIKSGGN